MNTDRGKPPSVPSEVESLSEAIARTNNDVQRYISQYGNDVPSDLIRLLSRLDFYVSELSAPASTPSVGKGSLGREGGTPCQ